MILLLPFDHSHIESLYTYNETQTTICSLLLKTIEEYDTNNKLQSNYQSLEQFKLARKYVDRNLRNFISHCQKYKLIPPEFNMPLGRMANTLTERGTNIRKKNIFAIDEPNIKKKI